LQPEIEINEYLSSKKLLEYSSTRGNPNNNPYQQNKQVEQSGEFMNVYQLLKFIWMILKAQMQTAGDETILISGPRWYRRL